MIFILTEKYRPTTIEDFVDNKDNLNKILESVKKNTPVLLISPPGYGKTTSAYVIAKTLGYSIKEFNASDERKRDSLQELKKVLSSRTFTPTIFLLDEVDGLKNFTFLIQILKKPVNPVILTANDKYIVRELSRVCTTIEFDKPSLTNIVQHLRKIARKENLPENFVLTEDIRSSINASFHGGSKYNKEKSDFEKVHDIFHKDDVHDIEPIWLIDNISNFYSGINILHAIECIKTYDLVKRPEVFTSLPKGYGRPKYPYYFIMRNKNGRHN